MKNEFRFKTIDKIQSGSFRFTIQIQNSYYIKNCSLLYTVYLYLKSEFSLDPLDSESRFRVVLLDLQFRLRMFFRSRSYITFRIVHFYIKSVYIQIQFGWFSSDDSVQWLFYTYIQRIYCADLKCFTWVLCRFSIQIQSGSLIFSTSMQVCVIGRAVSCISTLSVKQSV